MGRRATSLALAIMAGLSFILTSGCKKSPKPPNPVQNIFLVTIDTLRADHLSCYGYFRETSPFIDGMADNGIRFQRALSTSPVTGPSHASLFTGLHPFQHGVEHNLQVLDSRIPTIAGVYREAGFLTAAFTSVKFLQNTASGFEYFNGEQRSAEATLRAIRRWLKEEKPTRPLFAWFHFYDVHEWRYPVKHLPEPIREVVNSPNVDTWSLYERIAVLHGLPRYSAGQEFPAHDWGKQFNGEEIYLERIEFAEDALQWIDRYDVRIRYVDEQLRRLYDELRTHKMTNDSLWVITSDHGEGLGSHGYHGHSMHLYEEQLHVPLIIHATDGSLPRSVVSETVSLLDLSTTFVSLLDPMFRPEGFGSDGRSILTSSPLERIDDSGRYFFAQRPPPRQLEVSAGWVNQEIYAVEMDMLKLIHRSRGDDELYQIDKDLLEKDNLWDHLPDDRKNLEESLMETLRMKSRLRLMGRKRLEATDSVREELKALGYIQ